MTKEEDCQVLNLLDGREQICQFKEHLTRIRIMAERFRAGWTTLPASSGKGRIRKGQGGVGVVVDGSDDQYRTEDKIQESSKAQKSRNQNKSRKVISRKLPLKKHRHSSIYYHSAFTTYPRHKRPENISSNPDVLDLLLKVFSSRARVSTVTVWNPIIESWNQGKKPSFLSLPPLTRNQIWAMMVLRYSQHMT